MAVIDNFQSADDFQKFLAGLEVSELVAQGISQQGAIHAISFLMMNGCTEANAASMLASLRATAQMVRDEEIRRGRETFFEHDQTGFS